MGYPAIYYVARIYYPIIAAVGLAGNLIAVAILSRGKCGLSKCVARYLVAMAIADSMGAVFGVVMDQISNIFNYSHVLRLYPMCALTVVLRNTAVSSSVWITVAFTFDRSIAISSQKLRERYCTERTAAVVTIITAIMTCARNVPYYFAVEPIAISEHVPWHCVGTAEYHTSSLWRAYTVFNSIMTPLLPICLIVLFNALTVSRIVAVNNMRRRLRNHSANLKDPEVKHRRKSMILLLTLSINFILLWIPFTLLNLKWTVHNYFYKDRHLNTPKYILQQCGFMLQFLSTSTNTCIYTLSQRAFREQLKNGVKYVFTLNGYICNSNVSVSTMNP